MRIIKAIKNKLSVVATWFDSLSKEEQEAYIKSHPKTKFKVGFADHNKKVNDSQSIEKEKDSDSDLKKRGKKLLDKIADLETQFTKHYKLGDNDSSIKLRKEINEIKSEYNKLTGKETFRHHELASDDWFKKLSYEAQKDYIKNHPNSSHAKHAKNLMTQSESDSHHDKYNSAMADHNKKYKALHDAGKNVNTKDDSKEVKDYADAKKVIDSHGLKRSLHNDAVNALGYSYVNSKNSKSVTDKEPWHTNPVLNPKAQKIKLQDKIDDLNSDRLGEDDPVKRKAIVDEMKKLIAERDSIQLSSLEIASDWFESLTEKKQKEYLAQHPDSKFAHKLGKSKPNPKVTKSKQAQMEHLEEEGVDLDKGYFDQSNDKVNLIHTVADHSGKKANSSGASSGRSLLHDASSHKEKLDALKTQRADLLKQTDDLTAQLKEAWKTPAYDKLKLKYDKLMEKLEKVRDKISDLINK